MCDDISNSFFMVGDELRCFHNDLATLQIIADVSSARDLKYLRPVLAQTPIVADSFVYKRLEIASLVWTVSVFSVTLQHHHCGAKQYLVN